MLKLMLNEEDNQNIEENDDDEDDDSDAEEENLTVFGTAITTKEENPEAFANHNDDIKHLRKRLNIAVWGTVVPDPIVEFAQMKAAKSIKSVLLTNIESSEYKNPTAIQMQAIPAILQKRDVLGIAPTGSGKTAAFAIPMLLNLETPQQDHGIRSIVLAPTRELAVQIHGEFQRLSSGKKFHISLLSKASASTMASHAKTCTVNYDIVIATPLRLVHLISEQSIPLDKVEMICLDEADRLFEMGFVEQIDEVFAACTNPSLQRMMFSATMLQGVEEMAQSVLKDPVKVAIGVKNAGAITINQRLMFVGKEEGKLVAMKQLIQEGLKLPVLMFVQNKDRAKELYHELVYDGINVGAIHADRTKEQRDKVIKDFRTGAVWVLICTDLMSRGIDFKGVNMVINYDFPQSAVSYIHRIGRTGRNGRKGEAVTFFTESDMIYLRTIANVMKLSGCDVPDWMLAMKKASVRQRKQLLKAPPKRHRIETVSGYDLKKAHNHKLMKKHNAEKKKVAKHDEE
ncbi:DEAD/DEAH box RNA helicase [Thraustotheca clavata]|uniref:RNA helicase n=1 Tax=Thraustotheca clavata TaxID=74557 RepID=A0A1V9ZVZ5_9STRA|nr:DEAD/DEAH box RNA helicase [Thraustotheca clavata]